MFLRTISCPTSSIREQWWWPNTNTNSSSHPNRCNPPEMAHCCGKNNVRFFNNCPLKMLVHLRIIKTLFFFLHYDDGIETKSATILYSPCWWNNEWIHFWNIFFCRYTQAATESHIISWINDLRSAKTATSFLVHAILPCGMLLLPFYNAPPFFFSGACWS